MWSMASRRQLQSIHALLKKPIPLQWDANASAAHTFLQTPPSELICYVASGRAASSCASGVSARCEFYRWRQDDEKRTSYGWFHEQSSSDSEYPQLQRHEHTSSTSGYIPRPRPTRTCPYRSHLQMPHPPPLETQFQWHLHHNTPPNRRYSIRHNRTRRYHREEHSNIQLVDIGPVPCHSRSGER
jgi:hypothetical protein